MLYCETGKRHTNDMGTVDTVRCHYDYNDKERTYVELLLCIPAKGMVECTIRYGVGILVYSETRTSVPQYAVKELAQDLFVEADRTSIKGLTRLLEYQIQNNSRQAA